MSLSTTELFLGIAIALILGGSLAYIFWKQRKEAAQGQREAVKPAGQSLSLQIQAYERLILLADRISIPNLIGRVNQPGLSARDMQLVLTQTIRQEFEHNITQQIFVSPEAWDAVKNLKEQNIHIINQVASFLPPDASGNDLNRNLLEMLAQNPKASLQQIVSEVLSFEAKKVMKL